MPYIYKIVNDIDNKVYIGKTCQSNPYDRFKQHIRDSRRERCKNRQLYRLMNKYGQEHFLFIIIEEVENDNIACERECYWIDFYDTYRNGLNGTLGGDGKSYLSLDEKDVVEYHKTIANNIITITAKHFKVDRNTIKTILVKNDVKWRSSKEARIENIDKCHKVNKRKVVMYSNCKKDKKEFNSLIDASNYLIKIGKTNAKPKDVSSRISHSCKRCVMAYGYYFEYLT